MCICIFLGFLETSLCAQTYNVALKLNNVTLDQVFDEIEKVSDYTFLFSDEQVKKVGRLTLNYGKIDVKLILNDCLRGKGLSYRLVDRTFVLILEKTKELPVLQLNTEERSMARGWVRDEVGVGLVGVNIYIKEYPGLGIVSGDNGYFEIKVHDSDVLVFSHVGYKTKELFVRWQNKRIWTVTLTDEVRDIEEVQVVGFGQQRRVSVLGAISDMNIEGKTFPVTSFSNMIAGHVSGIIGMQRNGEPGRDVSEFWIRGISTFGANEKALILIDGVERVTFDNLIPEDIENFSVLKDATATAVYGARGANGVVLINTKRGVAGKMKINANARMMFSYLPRLPHYLGAYDYVRLANESREVRGNSLLYNPEIYDVIKFGLDPDFYPDVNWQKEILKKWTWGAQANINISGGGNVARYYISLNYKTNDAIYRESGLNNYHTNILRKQYSFRANLDFNVSPSTEIGVRMAATIVDMNRPGVGTTDSVWAMQASLTPLSVPVQYSTGQWPVYGEGHMVSPVVLLNETGFVSDYRNDMETKLDVKQNLAFITPGLSVTGSIAYDVSNSHYAARTKMPALYFATGRDVEGQLIMEQRGEAKQITYHSDLLFDRKVYVEAKIDYNRIAGKHRIGGLLLYYHSQYSTSEAKDEINSIPYKSLGIAGRLTYSYSDIYFSEINFGYNGSENFPRGQRFGFFPSFAVGWVISGYDKFQDYFPFIRNLKLRYSVGAIGNDQIFGTRFPYLTHVSDDAPGYSFGDLGENHRPGIAETVIGAEKLAWESAVKHNLGIELWIEGKFRLELDYFRETRGGIFMRRNNLPDIMGMPSKPYGNVGRMRKQGFDGTIAYNGKVGSVEFELRGNFTIVKNKILDYDESGIRYNYQKKEGKSFNQARGYIALGYFRDSLEIRNSPTHLDAVRPGDLKYKDINGDGVINEEDIVPIGNSTIPGIQYGIAGSFNWKDWDFSLFFRGAGAVSFFYGGPGFFPFSEGEKGNILTEIARPSNRWIPAWYSGNQATENPHARFPRLSYGENKNNFVPSTHWLANGSYFRLKTLELGYSLSPSWLKKIQAKKLRLSVMADNLHVWDKVRLWDPEQASGNGAVYPLSRSFLFNFQLSF